MMDIGDFEFARRLADARLLELFKGPENIVKWRGPLDARFLILTDHPSHKDVASVGSGGEGHGVLDSSLELKARFDKIFGLAFSTANRPRNRYAMASCCAGWEGNWWKGDPTALEIEASVDYVRRLIMAMPKLEMILCVGLYATELCYRNFDVHEMYNRPEGQAIIERDEVSWTMRSRKRYDKVEHVIIDKERILRYMQVAVHDNKDNNAFATGMISHIDKFSKPSPILKNLDVRTDERLLIEDSPRYLTVDTFKDRFHGSLRSLRAKRLAIIDGGGGDVYDDNNVFVDASLDPYARGTAESSKRFVFNYQLKYDSVYNCMRMHGATPSGSPVMVTFTDVLFTFYIRPNVAFARPDHREEWCDIAKGDALEEWHLDYLREEIRKRLYWEMKKRGVGNTSGDAFTLGVERGKADYKDQFIRDRKIEDDVVCRQFDFIRCDVSNYNFIEVVVKLLGQLHKKFLKENKHEAVSKKNASIIETRKARYDIYDVFSAEQMFGNRYRALTSHWCCIDDLVFKAPTPLAPDEGVFHATHLEASVCLPSGRNPIHCYDPFSKTSIDCHGMTSFDMPKSVQTAFDIESGKFVRFFGGTGYWDSPVICMCAAARRSNDKTDKFKTPSFEAVDGYTYYGFLLGTAVPEEAGKSELLGSEELYEFAVEKEMLAAYLYFYSVMKACYWVTHNGKGYDMPRVLRRSRFLGVDTGVLGYVSTQSTRITERQFNSRAHAERTITSLEGEYGITQIDTLEIFQRERKEKSNTLGYLSALLVGMTKNDMPYDAIMGHWKESASSRRTLLSYCYRDAQLPLQLVAHSKLIVNTQKLSYVSGYVSEGLISEKGMQEKVLGTVFKANHQKLDSLYIFRTNDYFAKRYNTELLQSVLDLRDDYANESLFVEDSGHAAKKKAKGGGGDKDFQVASITILEKRDASQAAATGAGRVKRQRVLNKRGNAAHPTSILNFFRKATTGDSLVHVDDRKDENGRVRAPMEPITLSTWERVVKEQRSRKHVAAEEEVDDDDDEAEGEDILASIEESSKGKTKNRPAEPPPLRPEETLDRIVKIRRPTRVLRGDNDDGASSSSSAAAAADNYDDLGDVERQRIIDADLAKAKASRNDANRDAEYEGAVVMKERLGWYHDLPALCIDFASLYPSIKMQYNKGSNTKMYEDDMEECGVDMDMVLEPSTEQRVTNPRTGRRVRLFFLKKEIRKGVLATAEFMLLALRNEAKKLIDQFGNEFLDDGVTLNPDLNKVLAGVALSLSNNIKLLMNSMYGVCGAEGVLEDRHVAGSVTACGRQSIMLAKNKTMKRYNAVCVGGDTDSVFMQFPGLARGQFERRWAKACRRLEELGPEHPRCQKAKFPALPDGWWRLRDMKEITAFAVEEWVPRINRNFVWPMKVDFEKAMYRFVSFAPKRYSFFYAFVGKKPYLTSKGLETVRRDALPFTQKVLKELFNTIQVMPAESPFTREEDPDGRRAEALDRAFINTLKEKAVALIRKRAKQLAKGKVSIADLILSKQRSKEYYTNQNQEHLTVVRKLEERGLEAPTVGSRVFFVYTHMNTAKKNEARHGYEIADDPECVVKEGLPVDYMYYLDHKFKKSIVRTMRFFLYEEMVERIRKRKYEEYMTGCGEEGRGRSSLKRRKIVLDEDGNIPITMKDVTDETEDYLFGTARSGSVYARNVQMRYLDLAGGRVRTAHVDTKNKSLISGYLEKDETRFDSLRRKYQTDDHRLIIEEEMAIVEEKAAEYSKCLEACRACLKIPESKPVECVAHNCHRYFPRLSSQSDYLKVERELEELCDDIESLFILQTPTTTK